jgi:CheY-like chemotaxis protein
MALAQPTVLIVDDNDNVRLMLRTTLESGGYRVLEAAGGEEAFKLIRTKRPSVVVLDLRMPGFDGMELLQVLRGDFDGPKPKVIVLTAHASVPVVVRAMRLGAMDVLEKPVLPEDIRLSIASVLEEERDALTEQKRSGNGHLLQLVREELRRHNVSAAGELLEKAAETGEADSDYLNLLGVFHEMQGHRRRARKFYTQALRASDRYEPAAINLRRLQELKTRSEASCSVALGRGIGRRGAESQSDASPAD